MQIKPLHVFPVAILLGLFAYGPAEYLDFLLVPLLVLMLTVSLKDISVQDLRHPGAGSRFVFLTYAHTVIMLLLAALIIQDPEYLRAMQLFALMPPAVLIISFTYLFRARVALAFDAIIIAYLAAIPIIPVGSLLLFGEAVMPWQILQSVGIVIVLPFLLSRGLHALEKRKRLMSRAAVSTVITLCIGLSIYIIIGLNRDVIFSDPWNLIPLLAFIFIICFMVGIGLYLLLRRRVPADTLPLYVMFGTLKNGNAAIALAILLFSPKALLPFAVNGFVGPLYLLFLERLFGTEA